MASIITTLPKELLSLIFKNLTKPNDRRRAAQVCKLFYEIVRHQSTLKKDNMLRLMYDNPAPIRVLENSQFFPFSKLRIVNWHKNIVLESAFWTLHGHKISELIIFATEIAVTIETFLNTLSEYFPNLKKLTFDSIFSKCSDAGNNSQNISLPIEDLTLGTRTMPLDHLKTLLRCSPLLKHLEIKWDDEKQLPQILPWLDSIESSRMNFGETIPLEKLINLPSKVVIDKLTIKVNETSKTIREFFKRPRTIDELVLRRWEITDNRTAPIYFTRDQMMALREVKSINKVYLPLGVLEFEGSLDFLAQLPGIKSISLNICEDLANPLYPFYWSLPGTAQKIHEIPFFKVTNLNYLAGLSSVKSLHMSLDMYYPSSFHRGISSNEIHTLICNCPNLKELTLDRIDVSDADLIGHGDLLPIYSLKKLEFLDIWYAPNITMEVFKTAFKFPNLKYLALRSHNLSKEQTFNQNVTMLFTQNCPKLENLLIYNCPIIEEGFDYLIRHLPYLRSIYIQPKGKLHLVSKDKIEKMQKEFPYIKITVWGTKGY